MNTRPIPGFHGYFADADGGIWSATVWRGQNLRRMRGQADKDGYLRVRLTVSGKHVKRGAHTLVCLTFHGEKPSAGHEVRHLDGNRQNNSPRNHGF